jgi:hypothetical protein
MPNSRKNPAQDVADETANPHEDQRNDLDGLTHAEVQMAVRQQLAYNEERAALNKRVGGFRKRMKLKGITLGTLDRMIRMLEWTPEEIKADFAEAEFYAEAMRYPVGTQLELFGGDNTPDGVREQLKWGNIGYKDGLAGRGWPNEPPAGCPPECAPEYARKHDEGTQLVLAAIKHATETGHVVLEPEPEGDAADDANAPAESGLTAEQMEAQLGDDDAKVPAEAAVH